MTYRWLLPEAIEDILPAKARRMEALRRRLLDAYAVRGYEYVIPPLLEFTDSLLTGTGRDLDLRTFKLVDQLSGRTMGLRADITPQVARIDAHLLNREGVVRLCYCGSVLHTLPAGFNATREPLQVGAELYGHGGLEADREVLRLLAESLALCDLPAARIDIGHVGLFHALAPATGLGKEALQEVFAALRGKDLPGLRELLRQVPTAARDPLLALPECYGGVEALDRAAKALPATAEITAALADLRRLAAELADLPISFDLADLRGYDYESGIFFAAYCQGQPGAIALGGRYDAVGKAFGRGRPATGFSLDLRQVAAISSNGAIPGAILAPADDDAGLRAEVARLRQTGETVMAALPGHQGTWRAAGCDRQLVRRGNQWILEALKD